MGRSQNSFGNLPTTQKRKRPRLFRVRGRPCRTILPENCSQPLDVLLRIGAVVIRFVTQSSLISTQIALTPSSLRPHRQPPRLRTWNHQTTFCHGARFLSCIWPAGSFVSSLHRKTSHRAEGP